jgi:hypothetical protein
MSVHAKLFLWYLFACVIVGVLFTIEHYYVKATPYVENEISSLTPLQEKQFQLFLEMNHLLVTLATLVLGGAGAFVFNRYKTSRVASGQIARAVQTWVFSGFSVYCGYLAYEKVLWMLKFSFFNLDNPLVRWASRAQFWLFAISLVFLGSFLFYGLHEDAPPEAPAPMKKGTP